MARIDNQAQLRLQERLAYLRTTLNDLKAVQTFGSNNFAIHALSTKPPTGSNTPVVDWTATLDPNTLHCFEVTVTPNSAKSNPQICLWFTFVMYGNNYNSYITVIPKPASGGVQKWHVWIQNPLSSPGVMNFSVAFLAVSDGIRTFARIV
jgi:hypothetical protein